MRTHEAVRNPHFDDGLVVWSDEHSGRYGPPPTSYSEQFELQWRRALEGDPAYRDNPGTSTDDAYVADRVYEWTGEHPSGNGFHDPTMGSRVLDHPIDPALIRGKVCVDVGCGMGRWTRTMQAIGAARVLSIDLSESGLANVARFNDWTLCADVMAIPEEHPELVGAFDFANFWGVAMCTHDPRRAFRSAQSTVRPGGHLYLMVYAPEGIHGHPQTTRVRRRFHELETVEERLAWVDHVQSRAWDPAYPLGENLRNVWRRARRNERSSKTAVLDLLEPFYNWVIPLDVVRGWFADAGFVDVTLLNEHQSPRCAWHVLGRKDG